MSPNKEFQAAAHKLSLCDRLRTLQSNNALPVGRRLNPDVGLKKTRMNRFTRLSGLLFLGLLLSSCHHPNPDLLFEWSCPTLSGGDGSTPDQAIILKNISTFYIGRQVQAEWIKTHYPEGAIRDVREDIFKNRIIKEMIIEAAPDRTNSVFFDVTELQMKPDLGVWYFISDDGCWSRAGMITIEDLHLGSSTPWQPIIGERSGKIICQVDDQVGDGLVQVGELKGGKKHGIWKSMRPLEGLMTEEYIEGQKQ